MLMYLATISKKQKTLKQNLLLLGIGSGSLIKWFGSADPDPYQNVAKTERLGAGRVYIFSIVRSFESLNKLLLNSIRCQGRSFHNAN
jgi:hypothetical protein